MLTLQSKIDAYLADEQAKRATRERSGKYSPSMFGRCFRAQYWNRKNEPPTNPPDARTLRVFKCGKLFHDFVQGFIPKAETEVMIDTVDIRGYADVVSEDTVYDIKSVHSGKFHHMQEPEFDFSQDEFPRVLQVMTYAYFLNKEKGVLVYISKDDLCISEPVFMMERWKEDIEKEISALKRVWEDPLNPPPAVPRAYKKSNDGFIECRKYCSWRDKCVSLGHVIPPEPKKTYRRK